MELKELKAVIDNAPEGATRYGEGDYFNNECSICFRNGKELTNYEPVIGLRSLSDIQAIVELMEWQENVFLVSPNIDLDIEHYTRTN